MAYASYPQGNGNSPIGAQASSPNEKSTQKRLLAKCFGYMSLGLAISALVAFLASLLFVYVLAWTADPSTGEISDVAYIGYIAVMVVSGIGLLIDGIVVSAVIAKNKHSAWVPYIIYCVLMGVLLSSLLIAGISFYTVAETFLLTSFAFLAMFLIGYFSKANLNVFGMILGMVAMLLLLSVSFWGIMVLVTGNSFLYYLYDMIVSGVVMVVSILVVAIDAYNIKRLLASGEGIKNLALFCAYQMYCDFIVIFLRVLYILMLSGGSKKR